MGWKAQLIVDFDLKYLNFSAKTKHTVKMVVNVDNVPRFFLFQSFQNIRAAQGFRNSQSKIQNYHEYSDEDHLLPRQELSRHLYPDTCLQTVDTKYHSFPPTLDR